MTMSRSGGARGVLLALAVTLIAPVSRAAERVVLVPEGEDPALLQQANWSRLSENATAVAFSPDARLVASGWDDYTVRLWDVATGREFQRMVGHTDAVHSLAFDKDGKTLASGGRSGSIRLWEVSSGRQLRQLEGSEAPLLAFSEDNHLLDVGGASEPRAWDIQSGKRLPPKEAEDYTAAAYGSRRIQRYKAQAKEAEGKTQAEPDSQLNAPAQEQGPDMIVSRMGMRAWRGPENTVQLLFPDWDGASRALRGHRGPVQSIAFSEDGRLLASGGSDSTVRVWDLPTRRELRRFEGNLQPMWSVAFEQDGRTLATGGNDALVHLWDTRTGHELRRLKSHTGPVRAVATSTDGRLLASGGDDGLLYLWEPDTGHNPRRMEGHAGSVRSVAFSPDGRWLVSGGDDFTVLLQRTDAPQPPKLLKGPQGRVLSVAFSPDGSLVAASGEDSGVFLWKAETAQELRHLQSPTTSVRAMAFSPDGKLLASSGDKTVQLWEVSTGRLVRTLKGHEKAVQTLAFSPEGNTLASGGGDSAVRLWDVNTGRPVRALEGHTGWVFSLAFNREGSQLASSDDSGAVRLWAPQNNKPYLGLLRAAGHGWLSHLQGRPVLRHDDGRFLAQARANGELDPLPPRSEPAPSLTVSSHDLLTPPGDFGELGELVLTLSNARNAGRAYWVRVEAVELPPGMLLLSPAAVPRLEPDSSAEVRVGLSYVRPSLSEFPKEPKLRLQLVDAWDRKFVMEAPIPLRLRTPELQLVDSQLDGERLSYTLGNGGTQATGKFMVAPVLTTDRFSFHRYPSGPYPSIKPGQALTITFELDDLVGATKVTFLPSVQFVEWPSTWSGSYVEVEAPWPYKMFTLVGLVLLAGAFFLYYDRVYRNPMVVQAAKAPSALKTYSLPHLPQADQALRRARRRNSTLTAAGIPVTRWERALRGAKQPHEAVVAFAEAIGGRLGPSVATDAWTLTLPPLRLRFARDTAVLVIDGTRLESGEAERRMADVFQDGRGPSQVLVLDRTQAQNALKVLQDVPRVRSVVVDADRLRDLLLAEEPVRLLETTISEQVAVAELSPYQVAGGVKLDNLFFGREREVRAIADRTMRNFLVVGQRQMGKSSLLLAVLRRLQARADVEAHYVELADADLHRRLAREREKLPAPGTPLPPLADIAAGVPSKPRVWLIDEADDFIAADAKAGYPVLQELRALAEEGRAYFVLAGFWELYRAVVLDEKQPLRNFGEHLRLEPLDARAAMDLVTEPMKALGLQWDELSTPEYLLEQAGRRANLLVLACKALVESLSSAAHTLTRKHLERVLREDKDLRDQGRRWRGDHPLHRAVVRQALLLGRPTREEVRQALKARGADLRSTDFDEAMDHRELSYVLVPDSEGRLYCPVPLMQRYIESERGLESGLTEDLEDLRRRGLSGVPPPV
ncbi:MAG TPA: hypothetical protein VF815_33965 [Myxococcaceae bacterium]|jgi:WD40 repeat protein